MKIFAAKETLGMIEDGGQRKIYLDANVFIYAFEGNPQEWGHLLAFFELLQQIGDTVLTSELTLAEVFAPSRQHNPNIPNKWAFYKNLFDESEVITLQPVTRPILIGTAELRKTYRLKLPDAIHIVTSLHTECKYFVSGDRDTARLPKTVKYVKPNAENIRDLMEVLRA